MKYNSILETVGRTPVVKLSRLAPKHVSIYAKIESFNPMGSVKDRLALAVIERAEETGALKPGQTVIEATSGNTGIGLAMVCARKGYPLVIVMAENFSVERRRLMRFLGAKVVLTPAWQKGSGMLAKAEELAKKHGWFLTRQFETDANADIHSATTAQEILTDFEGEKLDYWVSTFGTGGTLKGVSRVLKSARQETRIIVAEPDNSQILGSGITQPEPAGPLITSHPNFRPHPIQGTSPDFISKLAADALHEKWIDRIVPVNGADALRLSRELAQKEGIFVGISAGAALAGALQVAKSAPTGATILCMLPDTGERYLSTPLFEDIPADMTDEEIDISKSTPMARFDIAPPPPAPEQAPAEPPRDAEAEAFVAKVVAEEPVVMFALEWCEFCWAVRKLFAALSIPYRSVDLDSVAYQKGDMGGRIRAALKARTASGTIPQIFVGGEFVGGCTDVFAMATSRDLQRRLSALGTQAKDTGEGDFSRLLPQWLNKMPKQPAA
ncbi:MAG TPA: cysteine synthase A [Hyphomonadaceae bacterium]|jgi:cysteine synthase A|nr:cysteine synthase A [Hyphomonadaceae bacterium]